MIDDEGTHWIIEGKSDVEMISPVVIAKSEAAKAWVATVNASDAVQQKCGYLLAGESVIGSARTWNRVPPGDAIDPLRLASEGPQS